MERFILIVVSLFLLISCEKNSNFTRDNKNSGVFIKKNTFINSPGLYYGRDISIVVKEFKDGTIVYGIFDINNDLLYQRNINNSISNHMKWTIYADNNNQIWFYNADYQETNVFVVEGKKGTFIKNKNSLPPIPIELSKFIKE
ncbi:hypothetical protein [Chryseobacterium paludis]|uniref:hypothetical protein n=1 Tax=Chryseobacterium paludis TaxID=2956784 RepID=UPI0021BE7FB8|nr:hypothetical protein [Chryseobacterium paludis]